MSEPTFSPTTERMYSRLPEGLRVADINQDYALKKYLSGVGDIQSDIDLLISRFAYLSEDERLPTSPTAAPHTTYSRESLNTKAEYINVFRNPLGVGTAFFTSNDQVIQGPSLDGVPTSARMMRTITGAVSFRINVNQADFPTSSPFTFMATVRTSEKIDNFVIYQRGVVASTTGQVVLYSGPLLAGVTQFVLSGVSSASPNTTPGIVLYAPSGTIGKTIDITKVTIVVGSIYDGPSFSGSSGVTPLTRHAWEGVPDFSRSIRTEYEYSYGPISGATSDLVDGIEADSGWLPWLSQLVGVDPSVLKNEAEVRNAIAVGDAGFRAGSHEAVVEAVRSELTGTRSVALFERTTAVSATGAATEWDVLILTRITETPAGANVIDVVMRKGAKPAGIVLHHKQFESTWDSIEVALTTWNVWDTKNWTQIEEVGL